MISNSSSPSRGVSWDHQQNRSIAVLLTQAFNYLSYFHAVNIRWAPGMLGHWDFPFTCQDGSAWKMPIPGNLDFGNSMSGIYFY